MAKVYASSVCLIAMPTVKIPLADLEKESTVLRRELASIRSSAERSRTLSDKLEQESMELKSRIECAKYQEEKDRKLAEELEEELTELAEEVNAQLDELERLNSGGGAIAGVGRAISRALGASSNSLTDLASLDGGRSRASTAGESLTDQLESRFQDATSVDTNTRSLHTEGDIERLFAQNDAISMRSRSSYQTSPDLQRSTSEGAGNSGSSRRTSRRPPSDLQKQWEAAYSSSESPGRNGVGRGESSIHRRKDDRSIASTRTGTMIRNISASSSRHSSHVSSQSKHEMGEKRFSFSDSEGIGKSMKSLGNLFSSLGTEIEEG